jgi:hypothetical protein
VSTPAFTAGEGLRREQFIPVRKDDLLDALVGHGALSSDAERDELRQICRSLAAIYHYDYFDALERLKRDYFYFDPELDPHARFDRDALDKAYADLVESFGSVLRHANFVELSHAEVAAAHRQRKAMRVKVAASIEDFRDIRFFHRGHHHETVEIPGWLGLRKEAHEALIYDDVILFAATRPAAEISVRERKLLARRKIRPAARC